MLYLGFFLQRREKIQEEKTTIYKTCCMKAAAPWNNAIWESQVSQHLLGYATFHSVLQMKLPSFELAYLQLSCCRSEKLILGLKSQCSHPAYCIRFAEWPEQRSGVAVLPVPQANFSSAVRSSTLLTAVILFFFPMYSKQAGGSL